VNTGKIIRAALGVFVVFVLAIVVYNWYSDYKTAPPGPSFPATLTGSTPQPQSSVAATVTGVGYARIDGVNFRTKPASNAELIRGLKKNEKVTVVSKEGQWYKVKDSKGTVGWVTATGNYIVIKPK
jgi:N-acetylmuramoyl-L-alanine amidase